MDLTEQRHARARVRVTQPIPQMSLDSVNLLSEESGCDEGGGGGPEEGEVRVDDGAVEGVARGQHRVEARPVHPQQHGAQQREQVRTIQGGWSN